MNTELVSRVVKVIHQMAIAGCIPGGSRSEFATRVHQANSFDDLALDDQVAIIDAERLWQSQHIEKYGTSEGAKRGWDTRGRGTHEKPKSGNRQPISSDPELEKHLTTYPENIFRHRVTVESKKLTGLTSGAFQGQLDGNIHILIDSRINDDEGLAFFRSAIKRLGSENFTVSNKHFLFSGTKEQIIKSHIDHEIGHLKMTLYQIMRAKYVNGYPKEHRETFLNYVIKDPDELFYHANGDPEWRDICREVAKSGFSISEYSHENFAENFAEMHEAFQNGIEVPEKVANYIKKVDKALEGW